MAPERAYLAFGRLEVVYTRAGRAGALRRFCRTLIAGIRWTGAPSRARAPSARQGTPEGASELLLDALAHNPHAVIIHQTIWETLLELDCRSRWSHRYIAISRDAVFYSDPHICIRCRYRSNELLGSARTVTSGIRSWKNASRRPRMAKKPRADSYKRRSAYAHL